jgi:uncharacterized membrane-anchored protein
MGGKVGAMIQTKRALILVLIIPILVLAGLTLYRSYVRSMGVEVILPISGYDPRDLLSGHYLIYRIEYGVEGICSGRTGQGTIGYVCLEPKMFSSSPPMNCSKLIRGTCNDGRFEAGIEKYYVPEKEAKQLERQIQSKSASILLSITSTGQAQVKDLLVNGQSWKNQSF